jgi:hypothetical protein
MSVRRGAYRGVIETSVSDRNMSPDYDHFPVVVFATDLFGASLDRQSSNPGITGR